MTDFRDIAPAWALLIVLMMEAVNTSETYISTGLYDTISQKSAIFMFWVITM
jgi:hypothetical protein